MKLEYINPGDVVRDYCFDDTNLSYPVQQVRRFVAELGAAALYHVLTKHPHRQRPESMKDFDYCFYAMTYGTFTDQPQLLAQHMTDWFFWLGDSGALRRFTPSPDLKAHLLQKELSSRLSNPDKVSFQMASLLLDQGVQAEDLYTKKAIERLQYHFQDESYVRSFFCPPPHLFWKGQCFHWLDEIFPESPLLYPHDLSTSLLPS